MESTLAFRVFLCFRASQIYIVVGVRGQASAMFAAMLCAVAMLRMLSREKLVHHNACTWLELAAAADDTPEA